MILDRFDQLAPRWATQLVEKWRAFFFAGFAVADGLVERAKEAVKASQPGQVDGVVDLGGFLNVDALEPIARQRGIITGPYESPGDKASRCRRYKQIRAREGTNWGTLEAVQALFGGPTGTEALPRVRLVSDRGDYWTLEPDGMHRLHTVAGDGYYFHPRTGETGGHLVPAHPWDWDGAAPQADWWIVIYCDPLPVGVFGQHVYGSSGPGTITYACGGRWGLDVGATAEGSELLGKLMLVIEQTGCMGTRCRGFIFAFDAAALDPETPGPYPAAGMPDGTWGEPTNVGGMFTVSIPDSLVFVPFIEAV